MLLLDGLKISGKDNVVEFAPGIGFTAMQVLKKHPKSYTGIELNKEAGENLKEIIQGENNKIIIGNAAGAEMEDGTKDKVIGEAMLTMHADHRKTEIIRVAYRLLRNGGLYAIHELCLIPDGIDDGKKAAITKTFRVFTRQYKAAYPIRMESYLLEKEGFRVKKSVDAPHGCFSNRQELLRMRVY